RRNRWDLLTDLRVDHTSDTMFRKDLPGHPRVSCHLIIQIQRSLVRELCGGFMIYHPKFAALDPYQIRSAREKDLITCTVRSAYLHGMFNSENLIPVIVLKAPGCIHSYHALEELDVLI